MQHPAAPIAVGAPIGQPMPSPMAASASPVALVHGAPAARAGGLYAMAIEQEGSRLLQQQLFNMAAPELALAVDELAPHLLTLATNAFGNYLVSAMACLAPAHAAIHAALTGHLCALMQHPQGSRVCQAAFERLPRGLVHSLVAELEGRVCEVACGTHGSWSVVAAFKCTRAPFILAELARDIGRLSTMQNGSRVVQRVLQDVADHGEDLSAAMDSLLSLGAPSLTGLAQDRFGNYVVQIALRHAQPKVREGLLGALLPSFHSLALEKCGSNVAEVLVELSSAEQLAGLRAGVDIDKLRTHAYGSYVVSALDGRRAASAA